MKKYIPLSVPNLTGNEKAYVVDAIETEWVSTGGAYIERFEENISKYLKTNGAVACQSGTAGLHLALQLSGVECGDAVIVPTLTFIAAVNPVRYLGAEPIFMDCDENLTIDSGKLLHFIECECKFNNGVLIHSKTNRIIKAIVVVHIFGNAANMDVIMEIASIYGLKVIEDATEALGTYFLSGIYKDMYLGTIGDFGVYSFNGNKIITTGGGGMLVAKEQKNLYRARYLSTQAKDDPIYYEHNEVGYNYRMTNLQAAVGVAQLEKLEEFIERKRQNYILYKELLHGINGIKLLDFRDDIRCNYWFYSLMIDSGSNDLKRNEVISGLQQLGIQTRPVWGLIHEQKPYLNSPKFKVERACFYRKQIINIPCSSNLSKQDIYDVVEAIKILVGKIKND